MERNVEKSRWSMLLAPSFLMALALLLLNDHVWKAHFHNFWTGKVSDFAGLFAFTYLLLWACRCKRTRVAWRVGLSVGILFLLWKSPLSTAWLAAWNAWGIFPVERVIDYGDWAALLVLPIATCAWRHNHTAPISAISYPAWIAKVVMGISIFAFCATSSKNEAEFDAQYSLPIPPTEVVARLNALIASTTPAGIPLSLNHSLANHFQDEGNVRLYFHHGDQSVTYYDTLWAEIDDSEFVDQIRPYNVPALDTMYVNPEGIFRFTFQLRPDADQDTTSDQCRTVPMLLRLKPAANGSQLSLLRSEWTNCALKPSTAKEIKPEDYLRTEFERVVITKLK